MNDQQWTTVQKFIDANQIELVVEPLIDYMKEELSDRQFSQLGDLRSTFIRIFSGEKKTDTPAKEFLNGFLYMIRDGAIVGVDKT